MSDRWDARYGRTLARTAGPLEVRDPKAATQALRYVSPGLPQVMDWDADQAIRYGYMANVIAYRCVQIIATKIAGLPFRAGPDPSNPSKWNPQAPLARLLGPAPGGPAPKLSARKLWAWSVAQRLITGRWAWEIELDDAGRPLHLWPLASPNLSAVPTESGSDWFRVFSYGRHDQPKTLTPEQVYYCWTPSQHDFRQPESALNAARYDLSVAQMADRYSLAFLKNNGVPAAMVVTPPFPDPASKQRFRRQFSAQHQGPDNAGKVLFAEVETDGDGQVDPSKAIDVKVLGISQKDAQFVELHKDSLGRIAMALGVPWSRLDASGRTFDNADAEERALWDDTLLPLLHTIEDEINMDLAERVGSEMGWFDLSGVRALREATKTTALVGAPTLVQAQIMTINEARATVDLPPVPDGDRMMTADEILALRGSTPAGDALPAPARAAEPETPAPVNVAPDPVPSTRVAPPTETRMTAGELEQRRARLWARTNATVTTLEGRWESAMRRLFRRQLDATLRRLNGKRGRQLERRDTPDPDAVFDAAYWQGETADVVGGLYEDAASAAGARLADRFGISFDLGTERMQAFLQARSNALAGHVTGTTYDQIKAAMQAGAEAGEPLTDIAERIRHVFTVADTARSVTIARTEVISAFNGATAEFAATAPADVIAGQEWIATRDSRTREDHAIADGQVVDVGQPFNVGGSMMAYPGDPNADPSEIVNCRCTVVPLDPTEYAELVDGSGRVAPIDRATALAVITLADARLFDPHEIRHRLRSAAA